MEITITQILDDLRTTGEIVRRFERRYRQGLLDDGQRTEDYACGPDFT